MGFELSEVRNIITGMARWRMDLSQSALTLIFIEMFCIFICQSADTKYLQGHRQQLGKHRDPIGHVEIITSMPSPKEFWERFASQGHPVILRGAASKSEGMNLWTDEYLIEHFGDLKVKIESKIEKENTPSGVKGVGQDTIKNFVRSYQSRNAYIVSQLPHQMASGVSVLPFLTCGTFSERILEANLWMSSGGTKSLLHRDADNAINCLYVGTKDWILIHPSFEDRIPIAKEEVEAYGGFALLDPDDVDLEKYPSFADVDWTYANVSAGDCLFLPYGYWHQVRSYGSRNMAVSVLFSRLTNVDLTGCYDDDLHFTPLSKVNMVYTYDGYGDQTMGDTDPFELNEVLTEWCHSQGVLDQSSLITRLQEEYGIEFISVDNAIPNDIVNLDQGVSKEENIKQSINIAADKMMKILDTNHDGRLVCITELNGLSLKTLKILANILDGDSGNTEKHEFFSFSSNEIRTFLLSCMKQADIQSNGELHKTDFLKLYLEFGGSKKGGLEVYAALDNENDNFISREEFHNNMRKVLLMFSKNFKSQLSDKWEETTMENQIAEDLENELMWNQDRNKQPHEDL